MKHPGFLPRLSRLAVERAVGPWAEGSGSTLRSAIGLS